MKKTLMIAAMATLGTSAFAQAIYGDAGLGINQLFGDSSVTNDNVSDSDLIQGMIATERSEDRGWHPATPGGESFRLGAFTDGVRGDNLAGLVNDTTLGPGNNLPGPTKVIQYDFSSPVNVGQVNFFTANDGADNRVFQQYIIRFSTDGGASYGDDIFIHSHSYGSENTGGQTDTMTNVFRTSGTFIAENVTNVQFDIYQSGNADFMVDPYVGAHAFSGVDDGFDEIAWKAPIVKEIDILAEPVPEPATMLALGAGLAALAARRRRNK
jgi:hypothetical protein